MSLKTKVKVGNITNLSDARYSSGMGVDMLGFPVDAEDWENGIRRIKEITSWISGPAIVIEWPGGESPADMLSSYGDAAAPLMEITPPVLEHCNKGIDVGVRFNHEDWTAVKEILAEHHTKIKYLLITSRDNVLPAPGLLDQMHPFGSVFLGCGIDRYSLKQILMLPIAGISLNGSQEDKPGLKEYAGMADILEALEVE